MKEPNLRNSPKQSTPELRKRMLDVNGQIMRHTASMLTLFADALETQPAHEVQESLFRMATTYEKIADKMENGT